MYVGVSPQTCLTTVRISNDVLTCFWCQRVREHSANAHTNRNDFTCHWNVPSLDKTWQLLTTYSNTPEQPGLDDRGKLHPLRPYRWLLAESCWVALSWEEAGTFASCFPRRASPILFRTGSWSPGLHTDGRTSETWLMEEMGNMKGWPWMRIMVTWPCSCHWNWKWTRMMEQKVVQFFMVAVVCVLWL